MVHKWCYYQFTPGGCHMTTTIWPNQAVICPECFLWWCEYQVPLRTRWALVHMQRIELLDAAAAHWYGGVGQADGSPLSSARTARGRDTLLAGDWGAAAGSEAHWLCHTHLTVGQFIGKLMVLWKDEGTCWVPWQAKGYPLLFLLFADHILA